MSTTVKGVIAAVAATIIPAMIFASVAAYGQVDKNTDAIERQEESIEESEERLDKLEEYAIRGAVQQENLTKSVDKLVDALEKHHDE